MEAISPETKKEVKKIVSIINEKIKEINILSVLPSLNADENGSISAQIQVELKGVIGKEIYNLPLNIDGDFIRLGDNHFLRELTRENIFLYLFLDSATNPKTTPRDEFQKLQEDAIAAYLKDHRRMRADLIHAKRWLEDVVEDRALFWEDDYRKVNKRILSINDTLHATDVFGDTAEQNR